MSQSEVDAALTALRAAIKRECPNADIVHVGGLSIQQVMMLRAFYFNVTKRKPCDVTDEIMKGDLASMAQAIDDCPYPTPWEYPK